jgi:hypothetical protein
VGVVEEGHQPQWQLPTNREPYPRDGEPTPGCGESPAASPPTSPPNSPNMSPPQGRLAWRALAAFFVLLMIAAIAFTHGGFASSQAATAAASTTLPASTATPKPPAHRHSNRGHIIRRCTSLQRTDRDRADPGATASADPIRRRRTDPSPHPRPGAARPGRTVCPRPSKALTTTSVVLHPCNAERRGTRFGPPWARGTIRPPRPPVEQ